jgi:DNA-binding transcriptional ArsR family regulator
MIEDNIFKALADSTRRLILDELAERKEQTFFELCARLLMKHRIKMSRQAMAKHLSILERASLVKVKHKGRYKVLTLNSLPIEKTVRRLKKINLKGGEER